MDADHNPFNPGSGRSPPVLAGRDIVIEKAASLLDGVRKRATAQSMILYGVRGTGKTVLLRKIRLDAEARGFITVVAESSEKWSLPALLLPRLRMALLKLNRLEAQGDSTKRALRALAGFAKLKARFRDIDAGFNLDTEPGLADSGDLEHDLTALFVALGEAAAERETAIVLFIDEIQYVVETQLAALIGALHAVSQRLLPITIVGAGLPQLLHAMKRVKQYADRLLEFVAIEQLQPREALEALQRPIEREGASIDPEALAEITAQSLAYPYFLQEWGRQSWDVAAGSVITLSDVCKARPLVLAALDESFFGFYCARLTPGEIRYLRAMAELGAGPHRSRDVAHTLGRRAVTTAPMRSLLFTKGVLYGLARGETAFAIPLFDEYLRRTTPYLSPRSETTATADDRRVS